MTSLKLPPYARDPITGPFSDSFSAFTGSAAMYMGAFRSRLSARLMYERWMVSPDLKATPDWIRRSIRLSCCLVIFGVLGHALVLTSVDADLAEEMRKASNWAAITCVVVSSPLIGKVAEVSIMRIIGTVIGAFVSFSLFSLGSEVMSYYWTSIFVVLASPLMVFPSIYMAFRTSLDQLAKFMMLTYVIIGYNAKPGNSAALQLAVVRTLGIISGGLLSLLLAVIILPRSASIESCRELKRALNILSELNKAVWEHSSIEPSEGAQQPKRTSFYETMSALPMMTEIQGDSEAAAGSQKVTRVSHVEALFSKLYSTLDKIEEMMTCTKGEIYVHHLWGQYFFLPGIYCLPAGSWMLPIKEIKNLLTVIRRVSRLLWTLLLDFDDGFDESMKSVLQSFYPQHLMGELCCYTQLSLDDLHSTFPNQRVISIDNVLNLGQVVDCLIMISDTGNRKAAFELRREAKTKANMRRSMSVSPESPMVSVPSAFVEASWIASMGSTGAASFVAETQPSMPTKLQASGAANRLTHAGVPTIDEDGVFEESDDVDENQTLLNSALFSDKPESVAIELSSRESPPNRLAAGASTQEGFTRSKSGAEGDKSPPLGATGAVFVSRTLSNASVVMSLPPRMLMRASSLRTPLGQSDGLAPSTGGSLPPPIGAQGSAAARAMADKEGTAGAAPSAPQVLRAGSLPVHHKRGGATSASMFRPSPAPARQAKFHLATIPSESDLSGLDFQGGGYPEFDAWTRKASPFQGKDSAEATGTGSTFMEVQRGRLEEPPPRTSCPGFDTHPASVSFSSTNEPTPYAEVSSHQSAPKGAYDPVEQHTTERITSLQESKSHTNLSEISSYMLASIGAGRERHQTSTQAPAPTQLVNSLASCLGLDNVTGLVAVGMDNTSATHAGCDRDSTSCGNTTRGSSMTPAEGQLLSSNIVGGLGGQSVGTLTLAARMEVLDSVAMNAVGAGAMFDDGHMTQDALGRGGGGGGGGGGAAGSEPAGLSRHNSGGSGSISLCTTVGIPAVRQPVHHRLSNCTGHAAKRTSQLTSVLAGGLGGLGGSGDFLGNMLASATVTIGDQAAAGSGVGLSGSSADGAKPAGDVFATPRGNDGDELAGGGMPTGSGLWMGDSPGIASCRVSSSGAGGRATPGRSARQSLDFKVAGSRAHSQESTSLDVPLTGGLLHSTIPGPIELAALGPGGGTSPMDILLSSVNVNDHFFTSAGGSMNSRPMSPHASSNSSIFKGHGPSISSAFFARGSHSVVAASLASEPSSQLSLGLGVGHVQGHHEGSTSPRSVKALVDPHITRQTPALQAPASGSSDLYTMFVSPFHAEALCMPMQDVPSDGATDTEAHPLDVSMRALGPIEAAALHIPPSLPPPPSYDQALTFDRATSFDLRGLTRSSHSGGGTGGANGGAVGSCGGAGGSGGGSNTTAANSRAVAAAATVAAVPAVGQRQHGEPSGSWTVNMGTSGGTHQMGQPPPAGESSRQNSSPTPPLQEDGGPGDVGMASMRRMLSSRLQSLMTQAGVMHHAGNTCGIAFPDTAAGYASQMRWYSFQFIIDELVEELEQAFVAAAAVLNKIPYPIRC